MGWGTGPQRPQPRRGTSNRTQWVIVGCAVLAVALVAVGVVLLVTGGDEETPAAGETPYPTGTLYTPPTPTEPVITKGPHDVGVEVGRGVWFTPAKGWVPDSDKSRSGRNYLLPQFNSRGLIDGYYWVRQTTLYDAKGFAEHLVDIESNSMVNVRISSGRVCKPANEAIKACYALSYSAYVRTGTGKLIPFRGFVTAYQDQFGNVTGTDAGLEISVYKRRVNELVVMNRTLEKSF
ncbi:hypothetical protein E1218_21165 [Kribbella turkmenica]|uniref:Uncharacterized protein n=1 Tax=Kribbella turkmenica TaxID=2530375 RepID=A0A4R4WUG6_9ACTN|nr:hypothetical protein E1218_21165 [Kribbella turkmenica]